ncbi:unnamed protein product [Laminaria digitata]
MQCLRDGNWLNCNIMNTYMHILRERDDKLSKLGRRPHLCFKTGFLPMRNSYGGREHDKRNEQFAKRTKDIDTSNVSKIFILINIRSTHWAMIIVSVTAKP